MSAHLTPPTEEAGRVVVLPEELANQIAAGEVVERPAAAVKELVENSLDAQATRVQVDIEDGGRKLLRITDNGYGMSRGDARRALLRHATSKIRTSDDLFRIRTLGFRGEALPSIASVSRFSLETREPGALIGTRIEVEGGKLTDLRDAGIPDGTRIEVRDLFFNTPARLKFLKGTPTEARHISESLLHLSLSRHDVHFRLTHNGREVFDLPPNANLADRVLAVLGKETRDGLFPTADFPPIDGVTCKGYFSRPDLTQSSTSNFYVYVNERFVKEKTIQAAVKAAYRGMIEKNQYPTVVLFLDIPPDKVDVNVHPTKTEVRFRSSDAIFRAVYHAIHDALQLTPWVDDSTRTYTLSLPQAPKHLDPLSAAAARQAQAPLPLGEHRPPTEPTRLPIADLFGPPRKPSPPISGLPPSAHARAASPQPSPSSKPLPSPFFDPPRPRPSDEPAPRNTPSPSPFDLPSSTPAPQEDHNPPRDEGRVDEARLVEVASPAERPDVNDGYFSRLNYIGQYKRTYLICSDATGLVIVDQHASHERITFEHLRALYRTRQAQTQALLIPQRLSLDALRTGAMHEFLDFFHGIGFEIEHFGGNDFALKAVPAILSNARHDKLLRDTLDELSAIGRSDRVDDAIDAILLRMACHGSIRAGDDMNEDTARALFRQLDAIDFGSNCPHGRPVYFRLPLSDLEAAFGR
jgi:DNA mismatch repair protein MutL